MSNPLFDMLGRGSAPGGNPLQVVQDFINFKNSFVGNPQEKVQQLLTSGMVDQNQYNAAVQQAQLLQQMLGRR